MIKTNQILSVCWNLSIGKMRILFYKNSSIIEQSNVVLVASEAEMRKDECV